MSLIGIRRERKQDSGGGPTRPPRLWKLLVALALVIYVIWQLSQSS